MGGREDRRGLIGAEMWFASRSARLGLAMSPPDLSKRSPNPINGYLISTRSRFVVSRLGAGILVVLTLSLWSSVLADAFATPEEFLAMLEGNWVGKAEVTPIGPRPYDITFVRATPVRLEGVANPGGARHFWLFYEEAGDIRLRFLSTFAGNQTPTYLDVIDWSGGAVVFRARNPTFLKVRVQQQGRHLNIDVFHRDRLHVAIRLSRP